MNQRQCRNYSATRCNPSKVHHPRKRFGQNFLVNHDVIRKIVLALRLEPSDHLVEIGAGLGALTRELLGKTARFDALEIDRDLVVRLAHLISQCASAHLHLADALVFDFAAIRNNKAAKNAEQNNSSEMLRVVGNLPYNITTPLLFHLLNYQDIIQDMHFMVQREVAQRLAARVGTKEYGRLSVMVQRCCTVEILFDVSPTAFSPAPQVYSSVVRLQMREKTSIKTAKIEVRQDEKTAQKNEKTMQECGKEIQENEETQDFKIFALVVRIAFNKRRKTLRNIFKELITENEWHSLCIDSQLRPEQLHVENFMQISAFLAQHKKITGDADDVDDVNDVNLRCNENKEW